MKEIEANASERSAQEYARCYLNSHGGSLHAGVIKRRV